MRAKGKMKTAIQSPANRRREKLNWRQKCRQMGHQSRRKYASEGEVCQKLPKIDPKRYFISKFLVYFIFFL